MKKVGCNPYTLMFGKVPKQFISRNSSMNEIVEIFNDEEPTQQLYDNRSEREKYGVTRPWK